KGTAADRDRPREINETDLEAAPRGGDVHAAGTPGGGTAVGGLAGTNVGDGSPDGVDLEDALGSGTHDPGEAEEGDAPLAGPARGAVGGPRAGGRARGHTRRGLAPGGVHRGDSTVGADPDAGGR